MDALDQSNTYSAFRVDVPGLPYWSVRDLEYELHPIADKYLLNLRLNSDRRENTTKCYAGDLSVFLNWCDSRGRSFEEGLENLGLFIQWVKTTPITRKGRSRGQARSPNSINRILAAVRGAALEAAYQGLIETKSARRLFKLDVTPDESSGRHIPVVHRMRSAPTASPDPVLDDEVGPLLEAADNWRDRLLIMLLWMTGLRIGEALSLQMQNMHLVPDSRSLGCSDPGPHIHVEYLETVEPAKPKGDGTRSVPIHSHVVSLFDLYMDERASCPEAQGTRSAFVNLWGEPLGRQMKPDTFAENLDRLSGKANLERSVTPHMFRHAVATRLVEAGQPLDVIATLLGHASIKTTERYVRSNRKRLRAAVRNLESGNE